jgi:hypothetical protein
MRSLASCPIKRSYIQVAWDHGAQKNIRNWDEGSNRYMEKFHNEEIHNSLSSPNIITVVESKRMNTCFSGLRYCEEHSFFQVILTM